VVLIAYVRNAANLRRPPRHAGTDRRSVFSRWLGTDKYRHAGEPIYSNKTISGEPLEGAVWADVCSLLQDPERLRRELQRRLERQPRGEADSRHRQESIVKLKRRVARLLDAYENGWLEKDEFASRMSHAKERLDREQEACAQYERDLADANELRVVGERFEAFAEKIATGLDDVDFETKRKLIRLLVKHIEVDEDEIRIVYKVQPRPFAVSPDRGNVQHWLKL